jgi:hypothetical protein
MEKGLDPASSPSVGREIVMLEGVQNIIGRIQEIESSFQARNGVADVSFQQQFQQAQSALAGANFNPNPMQSAMAPVPGMQPYLNNMNPSLWNMMNPMGLSQVPSATGAALYNFPGSALEHAAAAQDGRQYWGNSCAHAVNDVLKSCGIDIKDKVKNNPDWVPNYADLGQKIGSMNDLKAGDLIIYNNEIGQGGYDHIGIYAGNGEAWNVSTVAGHKWVKTAIGSRFQEGRRITVPN